MKRPLPAALALLVAVAAAPAAAQPKPMEVSTLPDIFAAYQAICLAHTGDGKAQAAAAQAAPYGMKPDGTSDDGTVKFVNAAMFANVLDDGTKRYCMVTGRVADDTSPQQGAAVAEPVLGKLGTIYPIGERGQAWMREANGEAFAYMYMQNKVPGQTVASYMLGVEKMK